MNVEEQLRRAIDDHVARVDVAPGDYDAVEAMAAVARTRRARRTRRYVAAGVAVAAAVSVAVVASVAAQQDDAPPKVQVAEPGATTTGLPTTSASSPATSATAPPTTSPVLVVPPPTTPVSTPALSTTIGLWPFRTQHEVDAWSAAPRSNAEAWHLDAGQTALRFTQEYLGYTEINTANAAYDDAGARVTVGIEATPQLTTTAAVLWLVRAGSTPDAPWEVMGTEDSDFSINPITSPASSPLTVSGTISGVDENIKVQVLSPSAGRIGSACCAPAGDPSAPWSLRVDLTQTSDDLVTVAASTGGHLAGVERFTVTGVRLR